jgi:hypothetical protein|tara:strand:- start:205 stop:495 length:291 start_codon:yes stop_codon:yes gene_type:complete
MTTVISGFDAARPTLEPQPTKQKRQRFDPNLEITPLMEQPPIRTGTDRYRKMEIVMNSGTVGEALQRLKEIDPPIGGSADIRLAVKAEAIRLSEQT